MGWWLFLIRILFVFGFFLSWVLCSWVGMLLLLIVVVFSWVVMKFCRIL